VLKVLVIVCILLPLAELYLLITLGHYIGLGYTLALLAVSAVLGSLIARKQGERVFRGWRGAMEGGGIPEEGLLYGVLALVGGALLIAPGFISDVMGLALLLPPVRRWATKRLRRSVEAKLRIGPMRFTQPGTTGVSVDPFQDTRRFDDEAPAKVEPSADAGESVAFRRPRSEGGEVDAEFTSDEERRG
jgi:UPF0716 protein FxsA